MALEVRHFAVTIPAGTPIAAPVIVDTAFPPREVAEIGWRVPPGPSGLMGWRLSMGGVQVLPTNLGSFVVTDDERGSWAVPGLPDSGAWQVTGYNTDIYPHTVYLTFHLDPPGTAAGPGAPGGIDAVAEAVLAMGADVPVTPLAEEPSTEDVAADEMAAGG